MGHGKEEKWRSSLVLMEGDINAEDSFMATAMLGLGFCI